MIFKSGPRPSCSEQAVLGICQAAIENLKPLNTVLIFTHCDQDDEFNVEYGVKDPKIPPIFFRFSHSEIVSKIIYIVCLRSLWS